MAACLGEMAHGAQGPGGSREAHKHAKGSNRDNDGDACDERRPPRPEFERAHLRTKERGVKEVELERLDALARESIRANRHPAQKARAKPAARAGEQGEVMGGEGW